MKKLIIFIILICLYLTYTPIIYSISDNKNFKFENGDQIEITLCPEKETTITVTAKNLSQNLSANVTFSTQETWIIIKSPGPYPLGPNQSKTIEVIISSKNMIPLDYIGYIKARFDWVTYPPIQPSEKVLTIKLKVLFPEFDVLPKEKTIKILPFSEKTLDFQIRNGICENFLTLFSTKEYSEEKIIGAIFSKNITLNPNEIRLISIKIKTQNFTTGEETIEINFNTRYSHYYGAIGSRSIRIIVKASEKISISGIIEEINEKEKNMKIYGEDNKRYKVILRDEDLGKYKVGEYINLKGYYDDEWIYPIEIIKPECGIYIQDPDEIIFCSTCTDIKYGGEYIEKENTKSIKILIKNTGNVKLTVKGILELTNKIAGDEQKYEIKIYPESFDIPKNEEREINISFEIKENPKKLDFYLWYDVKFEISPSPPCVKEIVKKLKISVCHNIRYIYGTLKFLNAENKECILKGSRVLLFLNYEPKCSVHKDFKFKEGNFSDQISSEQPGYLLDDSFNTNLPDKKYYIETYTDSDGKFRFLFFDNDCKYDYIIAVLFETKEFKITYSDCKKIFFLKVNIKSDKKPCPEIIFSREIIIGKDTDINFPKDFIDNGFDPRAVAQIFCHMDETFCVFRNEKCNGNDMIDKSMLPINVCVYSNENGTFYRYSERKINIEKADSNLTSNDRPMNREWHEFGHFLHHSLVGTTTYEDTRKDRRKNHEGIMNDTTGDSLIEGFAEMTSMMILRILKLQGTCCADFSNQWNGTYRWGNGENDFENEKLRSDTAVYEYFDDHGKLKNLKREDITCESGKLVYKQGGKTYPVITSLSREEFGVAGLLLDLLDDYKWYEEIRNNVIITSKDDDNFSLPNWQDLFCLMKDKKIKNIKELYEALREKFTDPSTRDKIDKIFIDHGFFQDKNFNGVFDTNEKIGVTYRCELDYWWYDGGWKHEKRNKIEERPNQPLIPQASILVNLLDAKGNEIKEEILVVEVLSFDGTVNFSYEREAKNKELFYIFLVPNGNEILRIYLKGSNEKPLIITEDELWTSVLNDNPYIKEHTFKMVDELILPELSLEKDLINFDSLIEGEIKSLKISFWNSGRGSLSFSSTSLNHWISVEPKTFEGNAGFIEININTEGLKGGINEGKIKINGNFGEKEIKVKVNVIPKVKRNIIELFIGKVEAYINGNLYILDAEPYIKFPGRTMVPLRFVSESLGATVDYFPKVGKVLEVYIYFKNKKITLFIGKKEAIIDNQKITIEAEAEINKGRTFVPIRFIAETFGAKVDWDGSIKKVTIIVEE
ncbi:MAG: copper amine oxidase N-terminal domain-containing protein [Caldisericia bacterium]|nr:copper amine oxidase N-terminal domain-containing protein [Caldisericia bacterium]